MAKTFTGVVTSDKADKTISVSVTSRQTHPIYGKQYSVTRKYAAHDEKNEAKKGDKVTICESRPFSKTKSFKLESIIEKSRGAIQLKDEEVEISNLKQVKEIPVTAEKTQPSAEATPKPKSVKKTAEEEK